MDLKKSLENCMEFDCILNLVKECVEKSLGRKRTGLMLGLSDLPIHVGAFHPVPSNVIVLNRRLIDGINVYDRKLVNAYIFHLLLHEYLHSLGFLDEDDVKMISYNISKTFLGEEHPATLIIKHGMRYVFPRLSIAPETKKGVEIVDIEKDNLSYIG